MGEKRSERERADFEEGDRPRTLEEIRAQQLREDPGREAVGATGRPAQGVLVQVCEVCGKEYTFDTEQPPAHMQCEKCGNGVFRSFFDVASADDVEEDFRAATERDLATDDPPTDVTAADVRDLDNI